MAVIKTGDEGVLPTEDEDEFLHPSHIKRSDSVVPGYAKDVTKIDTKVKTIEQYQKEFARVDEECGYAWNYDWEADKNQLNILKAAQKASGQEFIAEAFSNSPPYFMTYSGCSSGASDPSQDNLRKDSYNAFAAYMADEIVHWAENGITFQSVAPMNEPDTSYWGANSNKQEGCHFNPGSSQSDIITAFEKELKTLAEKSDSAETKAAISNLILSGTDETDINKAITSYQKLTPEAKKAISRIDTHTYKGTKREELRELAKTEGKNLWMSEVDGSYAAGTGAGEMSAALGLAQQMITDLNGLQASAWILWNAVDTHVDQNNEFDQDTLENAYDKNRGYWGIAIGDHNRKEIVKTRKYYAYGQFSKYIRPGYALIASSNQTLAAYDPKGKKAVIVALNTSAKDQNWKFDLSDFKTMGDAVTAIRTSGNEADGENWKDVSNSGGILVDTAGKNFTAVVKANSITTFIVENTDYDRDSDEHVQIEEIKINSSMVTGSAPWNGDMANGPGNVVDGNLDTYFDGVTKGWVKIDLGKEEYLAAIAYAPRNGHTKRCVGASFYGSSDGENWTKIYTITQEPVAGSYTYVYQDDFYMEAVKCRYLKYAVPEEGEDANCNIAEIKLFCRNAKAVKKRLEDGIKQYTVPNSQKDQYTAASWQLYESKLTAALALVNGSGLTESAAEAALKDLIDAKSALSPAGGTPQMQNQPVKYTKEFKKKLGDKPFALNVTGAKGKLSYKSSAEKVASVKNGKVTLKGTGVCVIKVTAAATGSYYAKSFDVTIKVSPGKTSLNSVREGAGKKLNIKWKKTAGASGYEVQYCLKKNFKSGVGKLNVKKAKASSATVKKSLKKGKRYYVRVRAYKTAKVNKNHIKLYGPWSTAKRSKKII